MSEIIDIFPTPVKRVRCDWGWQEEGDALLLEPMKTMPNGNIFSKSNMILSSGRFPRLSQWLLEQAETFAREQLCILRKMRITNSWIIQHANGNPGGPHTHTDCFVAGIFYLRKSDNTPNLRCWKTSYASNAAELLIPLDQRLARDNRWAQDSVDIPAVAGDLLLLPSWVIHSVPTKNSPEQRASLAFNVVTENIFENDEWSFQGKGPIYDPSFLDPN